MQVKINKSEIKIVLNNDNENVSDTIYRGLKSHNESLIGKYDIKPFVIYAHDDETKDILGGIKGHIFERVCGIHMLWVKEEYRKIGIGARLLDDLETHAKKENCTILQTDTTEFQAKDFYLKFGFTIVAELPENFKGYTTHIMRKHLNQTEANNDQQ